MKLMILGAGTYQVPLIKQAKKMGHEVILISVQGNYPGFEYADKIYYEDTTNSEKVLEIAMAEEIDGICTTGTDVALPSIGKVVDRLGLCGASFDSALAASNKRIMKEKFISHNVRTAKFCQVTNLDETIQAFEDLEKPVIFKAVDSSGSRGIIKVEIENEIAEAFQNVMSVTKLDYFLVEEFIEGNEFGAQAFVYNGIIGFVMPHGDTLHTSQGISVPTGHFVPFELPEKVLKDIQIQLERCIKALELNNCAINADFILKDDKVYVLEIGARAGATCLPELVSTYYDMNFYEQMVKVALGEKPEFKDDGIQPCYSDLIISKKSGIIEEIVLPDLDDPNIIDVSFDYKVGDTVNQFKVGPDRIGQVIVKGKTLEEATSMIEKLMKEINVSVK